jgi:vesicle transport protein SEC22
VVAGSNAYELQTESPPLSLLPDPLSIFRSVAKLSIETSNRKCFHYLIRDGICFLVLTESSYPKRLSYLFLDEVSDAFVGELYKEHVDGWQNVIANTARPYAFIKFDPFLQRKQREFADPSTKKNTSKINEDLADIQSIMRKNIEEVLNRGEKLEHVSQVSGDLMNKSKEFKWGAKKLTFQAMLNQYGPIAAAVLFIFFVLYIKFFW